MIDRCSDGIDCEITLEIQQYLPVLEKPIVMKQEPAKVCKYHQDITFSIDSIPGVINYKWLASGIFRGGGTNSSDTSITVKNWETSGSSIVIVWSSTHCRQQMAARKEVYFTTIENEIQKIMCHGESIELGSERFDSIGEYSVVFENAPPYGCDSTVHLTILSPDTSNFEVTCFPDSFLNALTFGWQEKPLADEYLIFNNDSLISRQTYEGFIYPITDLNEELNIRIQPVGNHGCNYPSGFIICSPDDFSDVDFKNQNEDISIAPNPTSNQVEIFSTQKIEKVEVFDFSGRKKIETLNSKVDLSKEEEGIYFFKMYFDKKIVLKKLIKL